MVGRDGDLDVVRLARLHGTQHVVRNARRADMSVMEMEVRRVEVVRQVHPRWLRVGVRRQVVAQANLQGIARPRPQRRAGERSLVSAEREPVAADVVVGVGDAQRSAQLAIGRAPLLRLHQLLRLPEEPGRGCGDRLGTAVAGMPGQRRRLLRVRRRAPGAHGQQRAREAEASRREPASGAWHPPRCHASPLPLPRVSLAGCRTTHRLAWCGAFYSFTPQCISTSSQVGIPVKTSLKRR